MAGSGSSVQWARVRECEKKLGMCFFQFILIVLLVLALV